MKIFHILICIAFLSAMILATHVHSRLIAGAFHAHALYSGTNIATEHIFPVGTNRMEVPAPTGRSKSIAGLNLANAEMLSATVTWTTWLATATSVATGVATYTARVRTESSLPLLDRLVGNKPSIWGNKGFYILLGMLYITVLGLFLRQILGTLRRQS